MDQKKTCVMYFKWWVAGSKVAFFLHPQAAVYVGFTRGAQHISKTILSNGIIGGHRKVEAPQMLLQSNKLSAFSHLLCKHQKTVTTCAFTLALACWLSWAQKEKEAFYYYRQHSFSTQQRETNVRWRAKITSGGLERKHRRRFFFRLEIKKRLIHLYICQKRAWDW